MIMQLTDIKKTYPTGDSSLTVLKGISISIDAGDYVAIMGPSGSGKSTLMHIIGCLDNIFSGSYVLDNVSIGKQNTNQLAEVRRRQIGFIFQTFNLIARLTTWENVGLPMIYNRQKEVRIPAEKALQQVGLGHRLDHWPNQLSGGERQRVAIARALINDPSIVMADEPTGNLDSKSGSLIMKIIGDLSAQGKTIVLVTHDRQVAEHADRIIHLKDGEIDRIEKR